MVEAFHEYIGTGNLLPLMLATRHISHALGHDSEKMELHFRLPVTIQIGNRHQLRAGRGSKEKTRPSLEVVNHVRSPRLEYINPPRVVPFSRAHLATTQYVHAD